ncbi:MULTISPECIES: hypothetical protein [Carnobacterium]|uniref:hypothetical protein n=1 Tax=Carnobacterium TaxID=2747 RepID=UPI001071AE51|nr:MULTISPECIES: hypothetical protein [Carnobacterium]MDT1940670.1 hypothetical protein [Carnobacterium divergens]MDT1943108.1 hypothetical protein [Carnobacterium divergens]MDT1948915.1 hypothetical protein [Carnobacterium divergens]MDT1951396.1 hypothetical protein [Carnobacterium divergens]MDT1956453.1 hypothetical protein [Carnobacterium divergens]
MKKMKFDTQKKVIGGAAHYHWFCTVNNFRSTKYRKYNDAYLQASGHANRYGHNKQTSVINCSGNC